MKRLILLSLMTLTTAQAFTINTTYLKMKPKHKAIIQKAQKKLNKALKLIHFDQTVLRRTNSFDCLYNNEFDRTGIQNEWELVKFLETKSVDVRIKTYSSLYPGVIAKIGNGVISFKKNKLNRSTNEIANTLFHEALHASGFGHCGRNSRDEEVDNSVPYVLGQKIQVILEKADSPDVNPEPQIAVVTGPQCGVKLYKLKKSPVCGIIIKMCRRTITTFGSQIVYNEPCGQEFKTCRNSANGIEEYKACAISIN
jgi:hypothetical protein